VIIRGLRTDDYAAWLPLWQGYLDFYRTALPPEQTAITWARLLDPAVPLHGLAAERDGRLIGFSHYLFHLSTWSPQGIAYLEDLFVDPAERGRGVARVLIERTAELARANGADRLYWQTHTTNATARALYDRVAKHAGFIVYTRALP
jgi:GNAT superfamily N-acetyltransferase